MTVVGRSAWEGAGGKTVATTGNNSGESDPGTQASIGELKLGNGLVRIMGGALPTPSEELDHRYGLRDYGLTYSGLYVMENSIEHDVAALGRTAQCIKGSSRTVPISRKVRGQRVRSIRVNANGPARLVRRRGRPYAVVDIRKLKGRTMVLRISRRTVRGQLVKTKHTRLVCR
jgi:hypothetical protein